MARISVSILSAWTIVGALSVASAATTDIRVPAQFDGSWRITASTAQGPCSASMSYQVQIKGSNASVSNQNVGITGSVSAGGAVQATITQGSSKVPIMGQLDPKGSGSGTWRTSGGLIGCSGSWSAKRTG